MNNKSIVCFIALFSTLCFASENLLKVRLISTLSITRCHGSNYYMKIGDFKENEIKWIQATYRFVHSGKDVGGYQFEEIADTTIGNNEFNIIMNNNSYKSFIGKDIYQNITDLMKARLNLEQNIPSLTKLEPEEIMNKLIIKKYINLQSILENNLINKYNVNLTDNSESDCE
jgi:hypothetical protein